MGIRKYKATANNRRNINDCDFVGITKATPEKSLLAPLRRTAGRNGYGHITVRHRGGGTKCQYYITDFKRIKDDVSATVKAIECDPNRAANIALLIYVDGTRSYIIASKDLRAGMAVQSGPNADIKIGNALPLRNVPVDIAIHNVELRPGKDDQLARSAGASAQLFGKEGKYILVRLSSGEVRMVLVACRATVGTVGNDEHALIIKDEAGRTHCASQRPHVRGSVMNPNDRPRGGGEGKRSVGLPSPLSPWNKKTVGKKTRSHKARSNRFIVRSRERGPHTY